jgi:hypothetical protein
VPRVDIGATTVKIQKSLVGMSGGIIAS